MVLTVLLLATPAAANYPGFPDVPAMHPYFGAITDLASRGVINGYSSGNFGPGDPVARQQFAKMIVRAIGYPVSATDLCPSGDVPPGTDPAEPMYPDHYITVAAA
jgi:hypothetical protein